MAERIYSLAGVGGIKLNLFSESDISRLEDESRHVYLKACRKPNNIELQIQEALKEGRSVGCKQLRRLIERNYGHEVWRFYDYAQRKETGRRRSGDSAILHEQATHARASRAFGTLVQQIAIAHDSVEDRSDSIADMEFHLWEQRTRKWGFSDVQTDSLRLMTNVYRMLIERAEERASMREKTYARKLLMSMRPPRRRNVKEQVKRFIAQRRRRLDRRQLYIEQPYLRDLEAIVDMVDVDGMASQDALELIGEETEMYAAQKLKARALKREIESQREFIDQSVERLLLHRQFRGVLSKLNAAKYSYVKAVEDESATEKQGVLLKLVSGLQDAMELIRESLGYSMFRRETERARRLKQNAKRAGEGVDDVRQSARVLELAASIYGRLDDIPPRILDVSRLRERNGLVSDQKKAERALSFRRAMGPRYRAFDALLLKLADVAEQIVVRNQLMYLNALCPELRRKPVSNITIDDLAEAKAEAVKRLRERYRSYFDAVIGMIESSRSEEGEKFLERIKMKGYERYVSDLVNAEQNTYIDHVNARSNEAYRGLMIVKIFDAVDNVRTVPYDNKKEWEKLIRKVFLIEAGARRLEGFYREHGANDGVIGGIRGARLVLMNELHAELIKAARHLDERRDNLYRGGLMPFLVGQAQALYEKRREYLD